MLLTANILFYLWQIHYCACVMLVMPNIDLFSFDLFSLFKNSI